LEDFVGFLFLFNHKNPSRIFRTRGKQSFPVHQKRKAFFRMQRNPTGFLAQEMHSISFVPKKENIIKDNTGFRFFVHINSEFG